MSRLVIPRSKDPLRGYEAKSSGDRDKYLDRVAKYVPAEAVGVYASLDGVVNPIREAVRAPDPTLAAGALPATAAATGVLNPWFPTLIFGLGLFLAFAWVWYLGKRSNNPSWKVQAFIAIIAFTVWAYATKGAVFFTNATLDTLAKNLFGQEHFYNPTGAMVILILFSALVAFYEPKTDA